MGRNIFKENVELLSWIERRVFVTCEQAELFLDKKHSNVHQKLTGLINTGYLDRINPMEWSNAPYYYFITDKAAEDLSIHTGLPLEDMIVKWNSESRSIPFNQIAHTRGVNDFFCKLLDQSRKKDYLALCKWLNTRECRFKIPRVDELLIPDGYGEYRIGDELHYFFFEYDRQTESMDRVLAKISKYMIFSESLAWTSCEFEYFPPLLFLTKQERWARKIKFELEILAQDQDMDNILEGCSFMFSWECKEHMDNLLGPMWLKAGDGDKLYSMSNSTPLHRFDN